MLRRYNPVVRAIVFISDVFLLSACWILTYFLRFKSGFFNNQGPVPAFSEHLRYLPHILIICFFVFYRLGLYQPMRVSKINKQFLAVLYASVIALVSITAFFYFILPTGYHYSRFIPVIFSFLNIAVIFLFRVIIINALRKLRKKGYNLKHVLIAGSGKHARLTAEELLSRLDFGYNIAGFVVRHKNDIGREIFKGIRVIGTYDDLAEFVRKRGIDQIIFCLDASEERLVRPLLGHISNEGVDIKVILELGDIFTIGSKVEEIGGLTVLSLRENPLLGWRGMAKRIFDILVSAFSLIILSPFMALIALAVKLTSPGPVFYKQERVGMDGKKFMLYKFRSMVDGAESKSGEVFTSKGDKRVTGLGKFLRRFSLDELPQLFNVLIGDLSLVGPRPERQKFVDEFYKKIPRYMLRHKIKLGMTGWAQINGLRGESSIEERLNYDLYYINHWSFWFDIKIMLLTFYAVLKGKGAY
jgi:Undecaprenyl-phosphate glucose phosphotransferase